MLEFIGAVLVTIVALYFIGCALYFPLMSAAFGGLRENIVGVIFGLIVSAGFATAWWFIVGVRIHVSFG